MSKSYFLVQKITVNGEDVILEHMRSCTYIEPASMEGVKIILELVDHVGLYRDDYGMQEGAEIEVTFADIYEQGDESWIQKFIIAAPVSADGILTVNGFGKDTHALKTPADVPRFFTNKQPKEILAALLPSLKVDSDSFEQGATYHLNAGGTPSRLIRSMARDYGALCFICRGTVYFKSIRNLAMTEAFTLEEGNPLAEIGIAHYQLIGERALYERVLNRSYIRWDTVTGMETAKRGTSGARTLISVPQAKALSNQHLAIVPVLDIELTGNTEFMPAKVCSVLFHKQHPETELDETLPERQIINQVAHYQRGDRYQCRLELGIKNL